jgi:hypothetical protein
MASYWKMEPEEVGEEEWEQQLRLSVKGLAFLEHWQFEADVADDEGGSDK